MIWREIEVHTDGEVDDEEEDDDSEETFIVGDRIPSPINGLVARLIT